MTGSGARMPFDAEPTAGQARGFRLEELEGGAVRAHYVPAPAPGELLHVAHHATCPDAARFRRRRS